MNRSAIIRLAAPLLALCFATAALAESKDDGDAAAALATCMGNAQLQYLLELGQCVPSADSTYLNCRDMAELHYALAKIACGQKSAIVGGAALKAQPLRPTRMQASGKAGVAIFSAPGSLRSIVRPSSRRR